jgi:predicted anti-sigma-YlaC factor YlaD
MYCYLHQDYIYIGFHHIIYIGLLISPITVKLTPSSIRLLIISENGGECDNHRMWYEATAEKAICHELTNNIRKV